MRDQSNQPRYRGIKTAAVHAGQDRNPFTRASAPDITMSTSFIIDPEVSFSADAITDETPFVYTRWANPTVTQLERKLAVLEGTKELRSVCQRHGRDCHLVPAPAEDRRSSRHERCHLRGRVGAGQRQLQKLNIEVTRVDTSAPRTPRSSSSPNTRLVYLESPANPLLRLTDIQVVADIAHRAGASVAVNSTFATPIGLRPMELGADYVIHSLTKYICGHGDAIGGAVCGRHDDLTKLRSLAIHLGGVLSPFNAWLILRGAATLPLRMAAHEENAFVVARYLEVHPYVTRVIYPGLPSHPQHELAARQLDNYSGMIAFQVNNGRAAARLLSERLETIHYAVSLGHHRSSDLLPADSRSSAHVLSSHARPGGGLSGLRGRGSLPPVGRPRGR